VLEAIAAVTGRAAGRGRRGWLADSLLLLLAVFLLTGLGAVGLRATGLSLPLIAERLALPWVPFGVAVGVLQLRGRDRWPGVFFGVLTGQLFFLHTAPVFSALQSCAFALGAVATGTLLDKWRVNPAIERWRDPLLLWLAAGCGAALLAAGGTCAALASAWLAPAHADAGIALLAQSTDGRPAVSAALLSTAARWWANWTAGAALVLPALYALRRRVRGAYREHAVELSALGLAVGAWCVVALSPHSWGWHVPAGVAAELVVAWAAIRFGAPLAALATLAFSMATSISFIGDRGILEAATGAGVADVWSFIAQLALLGMFIASLLAERDAASGRQAASEARYRTLFDSNPQPLWVHDPTSQRILIANAAAVRHYGYTHEAFTQLTLADLEAGGAPRGEDERRGLDDGEHRHRTHDGAVIAVELHSAPIEFEGRTARLVFADDVTDRNRLRGALLEAGDRAGRELGQELHDGLGQELVALTLLARSERRAGAADGESKLELIESVAMRALESCRNVARGLSALAETGGDLQGALERLPRRFQHDGPPRIRVSIQDAAELTLPVSTRDHIFRIAQEALTNAVKHAGAQSIDISCEIGADKVTLRVRDDGRGLPASPAIVAGLGRASMRHRASAIGARLYVGAAAGGGTEVRLECPQRSRAQKSGG